MAAFPCLPATRYQQRTRTALALNVAERRRVCRPSRPGSGAGALCPQTDGYPAGTDTAYPWRGDGSRCSAIWLVHPGAEPDPNGLRRRYGDQAGPSWRSHQPRTPRPPHPTNNSTMNLEPNALKIGEVTEILVVQSLGPRSRGRTRRMDQPRITISIASGRTP